MKRKQVFFIAVLLVSTILSIDALSSPKNLFVNGSFEELDAQGKPVGWPQMPDAFTVDNNVAFMGNRSIHAKIDKGNVRIYQIIKEVKAGETYHFSAWVKTKSGKARFKTEWVGENYREDLSPNFTTGNSWKKFTWELTPPEGVQLLRMFILLYGPGEAWFDQIYFGTEPEGNTLASLDKKYFYPGEAMKIKLYTSERTVRDLTYALYRDDKRVLTKPLPTLSYGENLLQVFLADDLSVGLYKLKIYQLDKEIFESDLYVTD